jgi:hypothetical protein
MSPILLAALVAVLTPLVFMPGFGCEFVEDKLFQCPGHPLIEWLVDSGRGLALGALVSTPMAIVMFFSCRWFARRAQGGRAS